MEYDIEIDCYGFKTYYKKGTQIIHRKDGPAIITELGSLHWLINGKRHRTDGPAIEYYNGNKEWFIDGKRLSEEKEVILNQWWNNKNGI